MAFFTRKGVTVPELPSDGVLVEESEEFHLPPTPSSLATDENSTASSGTPETQTAPNSSTSGDCLEGACGGIGISDADDSSSNNKQLNALDECLPPKKQPTTKDNSPVSRFDYVVDRTYGVEV